MDLNVREITLYWMRSFILSQLRERMMGEVCENLGEETTVRARVFWMR
jgi:hypothetical protein